MKPRLIILMTGLLALLALAISGCGSSTGPAANQLNLAPESALPEFVRNAPPQVKEAYRFAIANPAVLSAFPCYCGCGAIGHQSNLHCYVKDIHADGSIEFDNHAFG